MNVRWQDPAHGISWTRSVQVQSYVHERWCTQRCFTHVLMVLMVQTCVVHGNIPYGSSFRSITAAHLQPTEVRQVVSIIASYTHSAVQ